MFRSIAFIKWLLAFEAIVLVLGLMIYCGIIPEWGRWYSPNVAHRLQTEAFLRGQLALSDTPSSLGIQQGLAWAEGGVQQVSGLGIPMWRLPFEAVATILGQPGFPDRLALAAAFFLVAFQVFKVWLLPLMGSTNITRFEKENLQCSNETSQVQATPNHFGWVSAIGFVALLLIVPPLVRLLQTPLGVLDEVLAYVLLLWHRLDSRFGSTCSLSIVAEILGFVPFFRAGRVGASDARLLRCCNSGIGHHLDHFQFRDTL